MERETGTRADEGGEVEMIREYIIKISDEIMEEELADSPQELVRCEDCKYIEHLSWLDDANGFKCYVCRKHTFTGMRTPDWFCADGERKPDDA